MAGEFEDVKGQRGEVVTYGSDAVCTYVLPLVFILSVSVARMLHC